ncbi:MAG: hypothetical protein LPL00_10870 [Alphaproteobacteria bacterium]|nr:hypothetical protein [Alphaproteobacteria bacterium]MDX5370186.1 hypothetical protein [Alphaproteobacteria bacterium]MDX5464748.1 hypothetical protein [Alphaproteobacteria bacterium]
MTHQPTSPPASASGPAAAMRRLPYRLHIPARAVPGAAPLVAIHGISRNAGEHLRAYRALAESSGRILIAPRFRSPAHPRYQQLGTEERPADRALIGILDEVAAGLARPARPVILIGFSGGAQFAHRFAMAHPERVAALGLGAAGWYTLPDAALPYPFGLGGGTSRAAEARENLDRFLSLPIHVHVGALDLARDDVFRSDPHLDAAQGATRVERAARWARAVEGAARSRGLASRVTFELLPGCAHDFTGCVKTGALPLRLGAWLDSLHLPHETEPRSLR